MADENRPKPMIDLHAQAVEEAAPPRLPPPASERTPGEEKRRGSGLLSHLFAGLIGGGVVAGLYFLAASGQIEGLSLTDAQTRQDLEFLRRRTAEMERSLRSLSAQPKAGPAQEAAAPARLEALQKGSRAVEQSVEDMSARVQSVEQRTEALAGQLSQQAETVRQVPALANRIADAGRTLESLVKAQNERQAEARAAAITLALAKLKSAVDEGKPYAAELSAVEVLSKSKLPLGMLGKYKDSGILPANRLRNEFAPAAQQALAAYYHKNDGTIMGEVLSRARAAIQVRPANSEGVTVEAIIGRMDAAMKAGKVREALAEAEKLPDPVKEAMRGWLGEAHARVDAEDAFQRADRELLAALSGPNNASR